MQSQLSPLSAAPDSHDDSVSGDISPLSPHSPLSAALRARANRAPTSRRHPTPLEPLTFAKIALDATSNPSSAVPSTDSDWPSDQDTDHRFLSRSPSLLTSLIQSQSRLASCASSPVKPLSELAPATPVGAARPILRRGSATSDAESPADANGSPTRLRHRRSCLKFAVTPRPLQLQGCSSRRPSSPFRPFDSPVLPRSSRPESDEESGEGNEDDNEDENDDEDDEEDEEENEYDHEIYTPGLGSDFGSSDSDAGYREDSEDGFTSDEALSVSPRRWRPHLTQWTAPPAPILSRSPRRPSAFECPSTTDDGEPGAVRARTRTRIRIHDDGRERHRRKPTRHRSPPPQGRSSIEGARPAPPAARSPSAAELCRRRSGIARSPCPAKMVRGWRSDDGRAITKPEAPNPGALALALALAAPEAPRPRADSSSCVKFAPGEAALAELREGRERERRRRPSKKTLVRCHSAGAGAPPSAFRLARRDSAPAKIDEVHVLTSAEAGACPRRGLKHVLRRQVA